MGAAGFESVAILGLGLMGGSLGLALRALDAGVQVTGWNRTQARVDEALELGAIDRGSATVSEACASADLVVVATPVATIAGLAIEAARSAPEGAVITDVGSVKESIVDSVDTALGAGRHFVGGHPMCGSELTGLGAARADLYQGAVWVLTPTASTDDMSFGRLNGLLRKLGARVLAVDPALHDRFVAVVSHVPHLTAVSLMNVAARQANDADALLRFAAGGFRDLTRIAGGSPEIWVDICEANRQAIVAALDEVLEELSAVRDAVTSGELDDVAGRLEAARAARAALPLLAAAEEPLFEIVMPVPDRPGVLAEVSTLLGEMGINIADIAISHSVEAAGGVLQMVISGEDEARRAVSGLQAKGYTADSRRLVDTPG